MAETVHFVSSGAREFEGFFSGAGVFQRPLIPSHVEQVVEHLLDFHRKGRQPYLNVLTVARLHGQYHLVDGQHRHEALKQVYQRYGITFSVPIYFRTVQDQSELFEMFRIYNLALPVAGAYLVPPTGIPREVLLHLEEALQRWPLFSTTCTNRPYICIREFIARLGASKLGQQVTTLEELERKLRAANEHLRVLVLDPVFQRKYDITPPMLRKAQQQQIFLGLIRHNAWMDDESFLARI